MIASSLLIVLALLAPTFRLTLQAHIASLQESVTSALETAPPKVQSGRLDAFDGFRTILASPGEDLEKCIGSPASIRADSKNACVKSIQLQSENFAALVKALHADYHEIEAQHSLWTLVAADLLVKLKSFEPGYLKELSPEEAFNCALVLLTFNSGASTTVATWVAIEKLSKRFVPDQWTEFANWAIYVARPSVFTFPPQLFRHSRFSATQQVAMSKSLFEVVTGEQSFERAGFYRPKSEMASSTPIDANYVFLLIFCNDWDHETISQLGMLLVYFFRGLSKATIIGADRIVSDTILVIHKIFQPLKSANDDANAIRSMAVRGLITDSVLDSLKRIHSIGENCALVVIPLIFITDKKLFNQTFILLNSENRAFIVKVIEAVKNDSDLSAKAAAIMKEFAKLPELTGPIASGKVVDALKTVDAILDLVNELLPNDNALAPNTRRHYVELYNLLQPLLKTKVILSLYVKTNLKQLSCVASTLSIIGTEASDIVKGMAKITSIYYLLSASSARQGFAVEFVCFMTNFAQTLAIIACDQGTLRGNTTTQLIDDEVRMTMKRCLPRESLQNIFTSAFTQLTRMKGYDYDFLSGVLSLTRVAFYSNSVDDFIKCATVFLKMCLTIPEAPLQNYFENELPQLTRSPIYVSIISEWYSNPGGRLAEHTASYTTFFRWLVKGNHVSSSVRVILAALEE